jgi:dTDP-4-dehydrorhamnose reductase
VRLLVTGREGQVVRSLLERGAAAGVEVVAAGRPELDLEDPGSLRRAVEAARPDVVVSAAAYTAVDQAEQEPERARAVNADGPATLAAIAAEHGLPIIHLSTDYVFDGTKAGPYVETDPTGPTSVYGATKLAGERGVAAANRAHVILRTAWVYSPFGKNFVKTMLRLARDRDQVSVVADQVGNPTFALDIAGGVLAAAANLVERPDPALFGVFHMTGAGETSWAGFARAIFAGSARRGGPTAAVLDIDSAAFPTPVRRPANSRLDCARLAQVHGIEPPAWEDSLERCLDRLADDVQRSKGT